MMFNRSLLHLKNKIKMLDSNLPDYFRMCLFCVRSFQDITHTHTHKHVCDISERTYNKMKHIPSNPMLFQHFLFHFYSSQLPKIHYNPNLTEKLEGFPSLLESNLEIGNWSQCVLTVDDLSKKYDFGDHKLFTS